MHLTKANILHQLQKEILPLQGCKPYLHDSIPDLGLGSIINSFPHALFPLGAVHEFICEGNETIASTCGFVAGISAILMRNSRTALWISSKRTVFPPALAAFGIRPENIVFIDLKKEKEVLMVVEEALKSEGLAAVIGETQQLSFPASRRLQLAVEQSRVTGFIIHHYLGIPNTTACMARWRIKPVASQSIDDLPGVGFPRWNVELLKIRNGKPGSWQLEWMDGRFHQIQKLHLLIEQQQKKAG